MIDKNFDYDYLIVGQGIGGTAIAWHLMQAGRTFLIVDSARLPSSSRVAAGIFNPLTGKKLVKTWMADTLFPYAEAFYSNLEKHFSARFLHHLPILRPFRSIEEQNTYLAQTADPGIAPYVAGNSVTDDLSIDFNADFGALQVIRSGWVDLPVLLDQARNFFVKNQCFVEAEFHAADLLVTPEQIGWNDKRFRKVIFCQGYAALENQYFSWLPFTPVKGQILEIKTEKPLLPYIVNQGIFILPVASGAARVGATYSWDPLDWDSTGAAKEELETKLQALLRLPYEVTGQSAGIRPSVKDRRPLIGTHPEFDNVCIFNGLGTKGVTLAPYFAKELVDHLESGKELNPAVNIQRYFSLYFR